VLVGVAAVFVAIATVLDLTRNRFARFHMHPVVRMANDPTYTCWIIGQGTRRFVAWVTELRGRRALRARNRSRAHENHPSLNNAVMGSLGDHPARTGFDLAYIDGMVRLSLRHDDTAFWFGDIDPGNPHPAQIAAIVDRIRYRHLILTHPKPSRWSVHPAMIVIARAMRLPLLRGRIGNERTIEYGSDMRVGRRWGTRTYDIDERPRWIHATMYDKNDTPNEGLVSMGVTASGKAVLTIRGLPQSTVLQLPGRQLSDVIGPHVGHRPFVPVPRDLIE
jgi:hypothetical protein